MDEQLEGTEVPAPISDEPIRVLIVDDHALFRRGLVMVLEQEKDIDLVGEAGDGAEAVNIAQDTMPDVVLMDVRMPRRGGIEATSQIKAIAPHTKILMLTISDEEADLYDAIKAGASGYLLKEISIEEVANAIRQVHAGQSMISPSMASKLLTEFATMVKKTDEKPAAAQPRLTEREMEVLRLVAKGRNNRDIAKELFISENTVKNHIRNILEKLHLHSRMQAVVYAVRDTACLLLPCKRSFASARVVASRTPLASPTASALSSPRCRPGPTQSCARSPISSARAWWKGRTSTRSFPKRSQPSVKPPSGRSGSATTTSS